ncbi:putative glycolate oxidase iron-sulfur subunit [Oceanobacillus oncorhynchi subsp. incaldanensis]|uniref:(Fe-S)-binding protein n=1 Tax=Oceanobacillus oncorhynchi TaxID=545501 RepID=UPI001B00C991|nr:(Fe-S)-binding protein [Oceanobacillus oncorhynchi]GIO19518.1 putative glycolate oxidase iron-sulfur subunit [Oceanobacillus oncorhynchi subsp. incaldanensis]
MTEQLIEKLDYQATFDCVQCGYCLPACPTYLAFKKEKHSPRGRINLVQMAAEGKIDIEDMREGIDLCLGCRACETVCPTNVRYGDILMSAVEVLKDNKKMGLFEKGVRTAAFKVVLKNKQILRLVNRSLYAYQVTGVKRVVNRRNLLKPMEKYRDLNKAMPEVQLSKRLKNPPNPFRKSAIQVGFFQGCIMDVFFSRINDLAVNILNGHGMEVTNIPSQTCCGALQHHAGEHNQTVELAKKNIAAYEGYDFDYIVNTIGGCGATLKEYPKLFQEGTEWHERALKFTAKVRDISELMAMADLDFQYEIPKNAVFQPSCHLENVQQVFEDPLKIIKRIPGLNYMELKDKALCCGSAGIYNILHFEESMQILDMKMKNVKTARPELIITSNPGCHIQMQLGVEREGLSDVISVKHIVEVVAEACGIQTT